IRLLVLDLLARTVEAPGTHMEGGRAGSPPTFSCIETDERIRMRLTASLVAIMTIASIACLGAGSALAEQERVRMTLITPDGIGATIGTIHVVDTKQGLRLTPLLKSLDPGAHDIGIQENGDCGPGPLDGVNA